MKQKPRFKPLRINLFAWAGCLLIFLLNPAGGQAAIINVQTYGATPDDGTDDTAKIQAAINAAAAGDTVYFPNGTYNITGTLQPPVGNIKIAGQSENGAIIIYSGTVAKCMINLVSITNVEISFLTLDGTNGGHVNQGINADNGGWHFLHNLTVRNLVNGSGVGNLAGIRFAGTGNSIVSDNIFTNIGFSTSYEAPGIFFNYSACNNQILRNDFAYCGRGAMEIDTGSSNSVIQHNLISHSFVPGSSGSPIGIECWQQCGFAVIEDNIVDHWISLDTSGDTAVRRNLVADPVYTGGPGLECVGSDDVMADTLFTDNFIDVGASVGLSVSNNSNKLYCVWSHNIVQYSTLWNAQFEGDAAGLNCHYVYANIFRYGLHSSTDVNNGTGFRINDHCWNLTLDSNTIVNNGGGGIAVFGTTNVNQLCFVNNTITNNQGWAFGLGSWNNTDLECSNNFASGNVNNGAPTSRGFSGNMKPAAAFTVSPASPLAGQVVTFTSTSSDPNTNGAIVHCLWDFNDGLPSTNAAAVHTYARSGVYRVTLVVWGAQGRGAILETNITVGNAPIVAINAGGPAVSNFVADADYAGGSVDSTASTVDTTRATNPAPMAVYQTERYAGNLTYTLSGLANSGTYLVRLHFAEIYWSAAGKREFNVSLNGIQVLTNYDIYADAGKNTAVIKQFAVTADTSGRIAIVLQATVDNAKISAIEVSDLPSPWYQRDVGAGALAGSASYLGSTFTECGSGAGVNGAIDGLHYVYQPSIGDCSMVARVAGISGSNSLAKAGLMIRETTSPNSVFAMADLTPGGAVEFIGRTATGSNSTVSSVSGLAAPLWLKLARASNSFCAYYSTNGSNWRPVGSTNKLSMAVNALIGSVVTSSDSSQLCTASFDNVGATPVIMSLMGTVSQDHFQLSASVPQPMNCVFEASTNLIQWQSVLTNLVQTNGQVVLQDSNTAAFHARYFRINGYQ